MMMMMMMMLVCGDCLVCVFVIEGNLNKDSFSGQAAIGSVQVTQGLLSNRDVMYVCHCWNSVDLGDPWRNCL